MGSRFIYSPTNIVKEKCKEFAIDTYPTVKDQYARRGQYDKDVIISQIENGKIAEFAAFAFLVEEGDFVPSRPDLKIYASENKTFDTDLKYQNFNFHVKSCPYRPKSPYPCSWVFQHGDNRKGHHDSILDSDENNQIVIFCETFPGYVEVKTCLSMKMINCFNLLKLPLKESLKKQKRCIYWNGIKELEGKFEWSLDTLVVKQNF